MSFEDKGASFLDAAANAVPLRDDSAVSYDDVLAAAQALGKDSTPEAIGKVVADAAGLGGIAKRRVHEAIKESTGLPFSAMKAEESQEQEEGPSELELAEALVSEIGPENVLADHNFVWRWRDRGVWQRLEDRSVKQMAQRHIADRLEGVRKSNVDSVADLFKNEIFKDSHQFDVGPPECVNTPTGELVLDPAGFWSLEPHTREHYRTTQVPVAYDPQATAPQFERFLASTFEGDPDAADKRQVVLEMMGYTLMAHCRYEKFITLVGSGSNGKSVLMDVLKALVGSENTAAVQPSQFGRSFQRAHMDGKLANVVTEIPEGSVIDDAALKGITSGEATTVEHKNKDPYVMQPFATCWFGTNHMPHTRDFTGAFFRRAIVVEFNNKFSPEQGNCDPLLKDKLLAELPGILNMALTAYAGVMETGGFTMPASSRHAIGKWRMESDQVAQFVDAACIVGDVAPVDRWAPQGLYNQYRIWADNNGINKKIGQRKFLDRLATLGHPVEKRGGRRYVEGLRYDSAAFLGA
ncbi:phage/plasmid primase, P4 family [Halomonas piscis]|uniref:Phage/plasmid primase, P4 family n=1 Tax=Halomonas piscis TaxID=3031727 RepID=A0ABY9YX56_9GAMM|nr:phage/plasmid primase, P4 family [Halomonas piscis]WNK19361.1 phage/plasmid primase, P4 family [Halomonas piscis]